MENYSEENMPPEKTIMIAMYDIFGTPIKKGDHVINLFEIKNMEKHIAFIGQNGKVYWGYHPDCFRKGKEEEL